MRQNNSSFNWVLFICVFSCFLGPFMSNSINLAIPSIGIDFGSSQHMLNWVITAYLLAAGSIMLPCGRLGDIIGHKKLFIIGLILFTVSTFAPGLAFSIEALIAFRVVQGISFAIISVTAIAVLSSAVPGNQRGKAIGMVGGAVYLGHSTGPVLGGIICGYIGWRGLFFFDAAIALIALTISSIKLGSETSSSSLKNMDITGSLLCISGFALFLFGASSLASNYYYTVIALIGLALLILFFVYESKASSPLLKVSLFFENKTFTFSNIAAVISYSSIFALPFLMSLYLQTVLNIDLRVSGLILLCQPVIMVFLSPLVGRLSDIIDPRILASAGMGVNTVGLFMLIFLNSDTRIIFIMLNLFFIGIGYALFSAPNNNAVMGSVDQSLYGIASSTVSTARVMGQSVSMAIVSLVTSILIGNLTLSSPQYVVNLMSSMKICFIIFAVLSFLGVFFSLARGSIREEAPASVSNTEII